MASPMAQFLAEAFPSIRPSPQRPPSGCWIANVLQRDPTQLSSLSGAVEVVTCHDQRGALTRKLQDAHPTDRPHQSQYDERLLDCLTEACAFAWADLCRLGSPSFCFKQGSPDIYIAPNCWIEAKAIHQSDFSKAQTEYMIRGGAVQGQVSCNLPGLIGKFDSDMENAQGKFQRVGADRAVVFFNLTVFDVSAMPLQDEIVDCLCKWAKVKKRMHPATDIVACKSYDWLHPFCRVSDH